MGEVKRPLYMRGIRSRGKGGEDAISEFGDLRWERKSRCKGGECMKEMSFWL